MCKIYGGILGALTLFGAFTARAEETPHYKEKAQAFYTACMQDPQRAKQAADVNADTDTYGRFLATMVSYGADPDKTAQSLKYFGDQLTLMCAQPDAPPSCKQ
jgi:hypothetical protein